MTSNIKEHCKGVNSATVYNRKLLKFSYCWCGAHLDAVPFEIRIRSRISISFGYVLSIKTEEKQYFTASNGQDRETLEKHAAKVVIF